MKPYTKSFIIIKEECSLIITSESLHQWNTNCTCDSFQMMWFIFMFGILWFCSCKLILCVTWPVTEAVWIFLDAVFFLLETRYHPRPQRSGSIWAFDVCLSVFSRSGGEPGSVRPEPMGFPAAVCPGSLKLIRFTVPAICPDSMHHALGGRTPPVLIPDQLHKLKAEQKKSSEISRRHQASSVLLYCILIHQNIDWKVLEIVQRRFSRRFASKICTVTCRWQKFHLSDI